MDEDKYPHWKDALFGNHNAVANLRCAVHYLFWHGVYAGIALVGGLIVGLVHGAKFLGGFLGPLAGPVVGALERLLDGTNYVLNHEYTEKLFETVFIGMWILMALFSIGFILYSLYTHPWMTLKAAALILGMLVAMIAAVVVSVWLEERVEGAASSVANSARTAGEKAVETPGIRRVYGECPVSMEQAPKWFDDLFPENE